MKKLTLASILVLFAFAALCFLPSVDKMQIQAQAQADKRAENPRSIKLKEATEIVLTAPAEVNIPVVPQHKCQAPYIGNPFPANPNYRWCALKGGGIALTQVN